MADKPTEWFVNQGGKVHGPFTAAQLKQLAASNKINGDSQVRLGADGKWTPARNVKGLFPSREITPAVSTAVAVAKPPTVPVTVAQAASPPVVVLPTEIRHLTWAGHEFLDAAKDDTTWERAKQRLASAGKSLHTVTLGVLQNLLTDVAKQQLGIP